MCHKPAQHQDASQTQDRAATIDEIYELTCHLQRSARYHRARERFFDGWSNWFSFASLFAGTSVVAALLGKNTDIALYAGAAVAGMQGLEQVFKLSFKARDHSSLAGEFLALERFLSTQSNLSKQDLKDLHGEILTIEAREPPVKRYLDLICHNQVARAMGSDDIEPLKWWQRRFAQYLNGDSALQN